MLLQAVLFDLDGTLVDSNDFHVRCWIEAFRKFGKRFDYDVVHEQIGKGGDLLVPDLLNAREMRRFGEKVKEYRTELWKREFMPRVEPFPAARDVLESLHARGVKLALASSSNADEVEYYTQLLGVGDLLAASTSKRDAEVTNPSPEIFRAALERSGGDEERTLAVGDTPYDVLAAHRIPLPIAAVRSGGFADQTLGKAEFIFDDVEELMREIDRVDEYFRE
jgi:phosphoglycolate phosphatase-like HAD superfamily hydrolase